MCRDVQTFGHVELCLSLLKRGRCGKLEDCERPGASRLILIRGSTHQPRAGGAEFHGALGREDQMNTRSLVESVLFCFSTEDADYVNKVHILLCSCARACAFFLLRPFVVVSMI